ncbi:hypothetical protein EDD18DRAFT_1380139 [Armillaria luteobubalina]|uniref:Uncharacterized protein n=1 Tax=Armillaria luteobubalina TaxID=153913 RepID=A0AA39P443_9AGAR|nr:hypothetical protein EDD18DRAFT_1380139 [Armillaria luteobubalina]
MHFRVHGPTYVKETFRQARSLTDTRGSAQDTLAKIFFTRRSPDLKILKMPFLLLSIPSDLALVPDWLLEPVLIARDENSGDKARNDRRKERRGLFFWGCSVIKVRDSEGSSLSSGVGARRGDTTENSSSPSTSTILSHSEQQQDSREPKEDSSSSTYSIWTTSKGSEATVAEYRREDGWDEIGGGWKKPSVQGIAKQRGVGAVLGDDETALETRQLSSVVGIRR